MAQLSFKRYATTSSLNTAKTNGSLQEGNVVFDAELKILYIVTIKSGNIELEPYYGTNTTYTFSGDGTNTIKIKPSNANEQSITINNVVQAANATNAENDSDGNKISSTYLKLTGGTVNGNLVVSGTSNIDDLQTGSLLVNGQARFLNTINGNLKGDVDGNAKTATNAITATTADKVIKSLKWGSKTYNGSSEQTITAADLGLSGAMHFLGVTTSNVNEGSTLSSIIIDGKSVTQSKGDVVLYSHSEYIWTGSKWEELGSEQSFALKSVEINPGNGLTGGGTLEATRIISHADTSSQKSITTGGRTYINKIELDDFGHVTSLSTGTESDQTDISGNAATATRLRVNNVGSNEQPVYFKNGVPVTISKFTGTSSNSNYLNCIDTRNINDDPYVQAKQLRYELKSASTVGISIGAYVGLLSLCPWTGPTGGHHYQVAFGDSGIQYRSGRYKWSDWNMFAVKSDIPTKLSQLTDDLEDTPSHTHKQYALKAGDTITGKYKFTAGLESDSITTEDLIVNGSARFISEITSNSNIIAPTFIGDLEGNAKSANSAAEASKATNDGSGNNIASTYITDVSTSGQNLVVTKNGNNTTTPINIWEANLQWGGKNFVASYGPIDAAMIPELGANRFAFLKPAGITLEYSKDGGNTWTEETDNYYKRLFSTGTDFYVGQRGGGKNATKDWKCRVTINTKLANIYTELYKLVICCSTCGSQGCYGKLEASTNGNPTEFKTIVNKFYLNGWSGYNVINDFYITTYGNAYSQYQYLRLTFGIEKPSTKYNNLAIIKILAFGGVGWTNPSNMAKTGHLYSYNEYQDAIFPAEVIATKLRGNLDWSYIQNKPSYGTHDLGLYKISTDPTGLVTSATAVTKADITALGIPETCVTKINGKTGDVTLNIPDKYTLSLADIANVWQNNQLNVPGGSLKLGNTTINPLSITMSGANNSTLTILDASGDIVLTNGKIKSSLGFYQTSDIRKKTLESDIDIDFNKLASIPKKYFYWKDNKFSERQIGTIAQELLKIYPELVSNDENGYYSVDYARLSIVALAAIDKLNNKIEELENKIESLERR